jgi:hypothetical protein
MAEVPDQARRALYFMMTYVSLLNSVEGVR